jgi:sigma-B regulation protein RsbU (phosphoserine phosphatase)
MDQALAPDSVLLKQVQQEVHNLLVGDAAALMVGFIVAVIGLSAVVAFCSRRKPKTRLLLWFGLIALLYGVRMLAAAGTTRMLISAPEIFWRYLIVTISYVILLPFLLFIEEIYGKGWKSCLRGFFWIQTAYAIAALLFDIIHRAPESAPDPIYILFLGITVVLVSGRIYGYKPPMFEESRAIGIGLLVFILFVVNEHMVMLRMVPWSLRVEPAGFLLFVLLLGFITVRRTLLNEQKLVTLQQEMDAARRIQASILPRELPKFAGCKLAVRYVPMASVAGDYYDFVVPDSTHLGVLIADVAGHGVPAALIASMVNVALSAQAPHWSSPAAVMSGLNQVLCNQKTGQYVTAGYLFLDLQESTALYSGAAHPPLLLERPAEGSVLEFQENGLLLGFRPGAIYPNVPIRLVPGDRILMYTDGVTEVVNPAEELFGGERLKDFVKARGHLSANALADSLLQELAAWSGRKAGRVNEDDLTLIVIDMA